MISIGPTELSFHDFEFLTTTTVGCCIHCRCYLHQIPTATWFSTKESEQLSNDEWRQWLCHATARHHAVSVVSSESITTIRQLFVLLHSLVARSLYCSSWSSTIRQSILSRYVTTEQSGVDGRTTAQPPRLIRVAHRRTVRDDSPAATYWPPTIHLHAMTEPRCATVSHRRPTSPSRIVLLCCNVCQQSHHFAAQLLLPLHLSVSDLHEGPRQGKTALSRHQYTCIFNVRQKTHPRYSYKLDVRPSVRPSHAGIVSKRFNLSSNCLHCLVAPWF